MSRSLSNCGAAVAVGADAVGGVGVGVGAGGLSADLVCLTMAAPREG